MEKPKTGLLTSEFWLIVATVVVNLAGYVQDHTTGIAMIVASTAYAFARAYVKRNPQ